ncbi:hypothetical protein Q6265_27670, partial [Klebsiella pneumoniae]
SAGYRRDSRENSRYASLRQWKFDLHENKELQHFELVVRALDGKMFSEDSVNWQQYVANLPQSAAAFHPNHPRLHVVDASHPYRTDRRADPAR